MGLQQALPEGIQRTVKNPVYTCKRCRKEYTYVKGFADELSSKPTNICGLCLERKKNARNTRKRGR